MEAFSLLRFWRNSGADVSSDTIITCSGNNSVDVRNRAPEAEDDEDDSFFELVFTAPNPNCSDKEEKKSVSNVSSKCNQAEEVNNNFVEPPSKAKVFPIESNSKPQSPISLLKSAPKFRVFLLGFNKKSKSEKPQTNEDLPATPRYQLEKSSENEQSKRFTVKCKLEQVSAGSLLSRDNSLRSKLQRERSFDDSSKPGSKDVPKYLKLIKPLYIRASKRYTEKMISDSDQLSTGTPLSSPATAPPCSPRKLSEEKRPKRGGAGFRVVSKHLGKSRSASSSVGTISSPANRRDDSLLLQHDGIQSAILHCKRSYNPSEKDCSALLRSASEPYQGNGINPRSNLGEEQMRCSSI